MVHIQKNAFLVAFFLSSLDCVINGYDFPSLPRKYACILQAYWDTFRVLFLTNTWINKF